MTVEMDETDKLKVLFDDALQVFGLTSEPPDVNRGGDRSSRLGHGHRYGLAAVKGMGHQVIESIVKERDEGGSFTSLFDFCVPRGLHPH